MILLFLIRDREEAKAHTLFVFGQFLAWMHLANGDQVFSGHQTLLGQPPELYHFMLSEIQYAFSADKVDLSELHQSRSYHPEVVFR